MARGAHARKIKIPGALAASSERRERSSTLTLGCVAEPFLYLLFAGACTLFVAADSALQLKLQTLHAYAWARPDVYPMLAKERVLGIPGPRRSTTSSFMSDFARETARGKPFQWSQGAGYSSGERASLHPFVLAVGYLLGFRKARPDGLGRDRRLQECVRVAARGPPAVRRPAARGHVLASPAYLCVGAPIGPCSAAWKWRCSWRSGAAQ